MEKLEKLAAETKFSVYSRRVTLVVTGVATILIICVLSLFAAVIVLKLHTCSGGLSPSSPQALKDAKKVICLEPGCLSAAENAVECKSFVTKFLLKVFSVPPLPRTIKFARRYATKLTRQLFYAKQYFL